MTSLRKAFEDAGGAHPAANAHGHHAVAPLVNGSALQFADDGCGEFRARAAERMAQSDRSSVGINLRWIEPSLPNDR